MNPDRRRVLAGIGLGASALLAGCLDGAGDGTDPTPTSTPTETPPSIESVDTLPLGAAGQPWGWRRESAVGTAVVIDADARRRDVEPIADPSTAGGDALEDFLANVEYDRDRLMFLQSAGPDGCHDRLAVDDATLENDRIALDAAVVDRGGDGACTQALVYPAALVRVRFADAIVDAATVELTDGWGETDTLRVHADDPVPSDDT